MTTDRVAEALAALEAGVERHGRNVANLLPANELRLTREAK